MSRDMKPRPKAEKKSAGGMLLGIFIGLLIGVLVALGVAWYMAKMPMPFQSKGKPGEEVKTADGKPATPAVPAVPAAPPVAAATTPPANTAPATPAAPPATPPTPAAEAKPAPGAPQPIALPGKPGDKVGEKPRFEFYKILPGGEAPANDAKPAEAAKPAAAPAKPANEPVYLQAGAFQDPADADNLKARLALMGMEASVQQVTVPEKGLLHRVRIGPFAKAEAAAGVRAQLGQNGIPVTVVKAK